MVPSKGEEKNIERTKHRKEPVVVTVSDENETTTFNNANGIANGLTTANGTINEQTTPNGIANGETASNANGTSTTDGTSTNESQNKQNDETDK